MRDHLKVAVLATLVLTMLCRPTTGRPAERKPSDTLEAVGVSKIYRGDPASARKAAVADALGVAVGKMLEQVLEKDTLVEKFPLVSEAVLSRNQDFVHDYKVLGEFRGEQDYWVLVLVRMDVEAIRRRLLEKEVPLLSGVRPGVLLLLSQRNVGEMHPYSWLGAVDKEPPVSESALAQAFRDMGFPLAQKAVIAEAASREPAFQVPDLSESAALELGKLADAQMVVLGKAWAEDTSNVMGAGTRSYQGNVTLRALRTDSGEEVASVTTDAKAVAADAVQGGGDAMAVAAMAAGKQLAAALVTAWEKAEQALGVIEVQVRGQVPLSSFVLFRRVLKDEIEGVQGVLPRSMTATDAVLEVHFTGGAQTLARRLMLKSFDPFGIRISHVTGNRIEMELITK